MSRDSVIVYWVESDTGELRSQPMGLHDFTKGSSAENEVCTKYARDPDKMITIPTAQAGNSWARDALSELKALSDKIRKANTKKAEIDTK
jgi:hypothetical protein